MQSTHAITSRPVQCRATNVPQPFIVDRTRPGNCHSGATRRKCVLVCLEWTGAALGITGATLLAMHNAYSGWGWFCFVGSNLAWIAFGKLNQVRGLVAMNIAFTATSFFGLFNWHYQ